jgi:hypothetical protein
MAETTITVEMVVNTSYGGFSLSQAAAEAVLQRKGLGYVLESVGSNVYPMVDGKTVEEMFPRNDADLVAVVREMGVAANHGSAKLAVKTATIDIWLDNCDGMERIRAGLSSVS